MELQAIESEARSGVYVAALGEEMVATKASTVTTPGTVVSKRRAGSPFA